ncbi:MAG: Gx transporter family protein [Thermodesulfobacteriota bacterium]
MRRIKRNAIVSSLVAMSIVVHSVEMFIPSPFPWLRFGFANIIVLTAIALYGLRVGLMVTVLRVFLGTILVGTFLTPAFILGMGGGIGSTLVMGFAYRKLKAVFSLVGISVMGAYAHNIAQLTIVYLLFIRHGEVFYVLPVLLLFGILTGVLNGVAATYLTAYMARFSSFQFESIS